MMTKIREGYKETEIGIIPEDWEVCKVEDVISFLKSGLSRKLSDSDIGTPCLRSSNIIGGRLKLDDLKYWFIEDPQGAKIEDYIVDEGDILVNFINSIAQIGKACIFDNPSFRTIYTTNIFRIKTDSAIMDNKFFFYNTQTKSYNYQISLITKPAVNQASFTTGDFKSIKFPFPTLVEQQRIAEILSTTDSHIEKLDKTIEDYQLLKKGMMKKLLTEGIGHTEFKETNIGRIPKAWEVRTLGEICTIIAGQSPSSETYNESGIGLPFYQGRTEFGSINPITKKWCSEPIKIAEALDILISVRAPVGDVNICETKSCIGRGLALIRESKSSNHKFIYYLMQFSTDRLNKIGQGSTFKAINTSDLKNFNIQVPSIGEQELIADNLYEMDKLIELLKENRDDLILLKKSLMEKLLTGKVRVV